MIIDCHAHYEPRILEADALIKKMDDAGIRQTVLIPHLTNPPETKKSDPLMLIQRTMFNSNLLRPLGIAITKSMYRSDGQWNLWMNFGKAQESNYEIVLRPDHEPIAKIISEHKDRFLGWIFINPNQDDCLDQLERWREVKGMIGVKVHPFWHRFDVKKVKKVAERVQELKLPMLVHLGFDEHGDFKWLVENFPKLKIIFAHLGVPFYKSMWYVTKSPNISMDVSSSYHVDRNLLHKAVKKVGAHKCLFGTDSPYGHTDVIERIKGWVEDLPIDSSDKEKIFSKNFLNLIH